MVVIYRQPPIAPYDCANAIKYLLNRKYKTAFVTRRTLSESILANAQCIVFPGGEGDVDAFDVFLREKIGLIQDYVAAGGKYFGICMGAYIASKLYFNILGDVAAVQHIKQHNAATTYEHPTVASCNWRGSIQQLYFYDGPAFQGNIAANEVIATYANGSTAAITRAYGKGKVTVVGPHLESQKHWYNNELAPLWHQGSHHELLLDIFDELVN